MDEDFKSIYAKYKTLFEKNPQAKDEAIDTFRTVSRAIRNMMEESAEYAYRSLES